MRKFLFAIGAALTLGACAPLLTALAGPPVAVANQSVLDEKVAITVELAYKAARLAVETGVEAGLIKGQRATQVAELDNRAFQAVLGVRAAYRAGNSQSYAVAASDANTAIAELIGAVKGGR